MIKFFRHIRKRLLSESKFSKYMLYAIGEIILVVIGILIALGINNYNNKHLNKEEEQAILKSLNFEFRKNKKDVENVLSDYQDYLTSTKLLINLVGEKNEVLSSHNTDSLIERSISYYDYSPSQNVLSDLLSSGKLKLIRSDSLRLKLFQWSSLMNEKREDWDTLDDFLQNMFMPYLTKNASLKNIDSYGFLKWKEKSKLNPKTEQMFSDIEFENNLDNHAWSLTNYMITLENLNNTLDKIIEETSISK